MVHVDAIPSFRKLLHAIPDNLHYITPPELYSLIQRGDNSVFILDTRTNEDFDRGHIEGAVNIPLKEALDEGSIERLPRDKCIVICCWVGHTASQLLSILRFLGYDAIGLKYGMGIPKNPAEEKRGWLEYNFPVSTKS